MEMLGFYWPNIISAFFLVMALGFFGLHLIARNQSMEVMLLGQEFQTGILVAAVFMTLFEGEQHSDHGFHLESFLSIIFVVGFNSLYSLVLKRFRQFRVEGAIVAILFLMALNHLIVFLSPVVEFHMMKTALGDIVTATKVESLFVGALAICVLVLYWSKRRFFLEDSIEIGLFNKVTRKKNHQFLFTIILYLLMMASIHLFGALFTLASMLVPAFIASIFRISRDHFRYFLFNNSIMVIFGFFTLLLWDRLPTTVIIVFYIFISNLILGLFLKH